MKVRRIMRHETHVPKSFNRRRNERYIDTSLLLSSSNYNQDQFADFLVTLEPMKVVGIESNIRASVFQHTSAI